MENFLIRFVKAGGQVVVSYDDKLQTIVTDLPESQKVYLYIVLNTVKR